MTNKFMFGSYVSNPSTLRATDKQNMTANKSSTVYGKSTEYPSILRMHSNKMATGRLLNESNFGS